MYKVSLHGIRTIDHNAPEQLKLLAKHPPVSSDYYYNQQQSLPHSIEPDYVDPDFMKWIEEDMDKWGLKDLGLKLHVLDYNFKPEKEGGKDLTFPAIISMSFEHEGKRYGGPLFGGLQTCIVRTQSGDEPHLSVFNLGYIHSKHYDVIDQQSLVEQMVYEAINKAPFEMYITAVPSRNLKELYSKKTIDTFLKSPTQHLLLGGNMFDVWVPEFKEKFLHSKENWTPNDEIINLLGKNPERVLDRIKNPTNKLKALPVMISDPLVPENSGVDIPQYKGFLKEFIYYFHPKENQTEVDFRSSITKLLEDDGFLSKLTYMRHLVARVKQANPHKKDWVESGFDYDINMRFVEKIIELGTDENFPVIHRDSALRSKDYQKLVGLSNYVLLSTHKLGDKYTDLPPIPSVFGKCGDDYIEFSHIEDVLKQVSGASKITPIHPRDLTRKRGNYYIPIKDNKEHPVFYFEFEKSTKMWGKGSVGAIEAVISTLPYVFSEKEILQYGVDKCDVKRSRLKAASDTTRELPSKDVMDYFKATRKLLFSIARTNLELMDEFSPFKAEHTRRVTKSYSIAINAMYDIARHGEFTGKTSHNRNREIELEILEGMTHDIGRMYLIHEVLKPDNEQIKPIKELKSIVSEVATILKNSGNKAFDRYEICEPIVDAITLEFCLKHHYGKCSDMTRSFVDAKDIIRSGDIHDRVVKIFDEELPKISKALDNYHIEILEKLTRSPLLSHFRESAFHHYDFGGQATPAYLSKKEDTSSKYNFIHEHWVLPIVDKFDVNMTIRKDYSRSLLFLAYASETRKHDMTTHPGVLKHLYEKGVMAKIAQDVYGVDPELNKKITNQHLRLVLDESENPKKDEDVRNNLLESKLPNEVKHSLEMLHQAFKAYLRDGEKTVYEGILKFNTLRDFLDNKIGKLSELTKDELCALFPEKSQDKPIKTQKTENYITRINKKTEIYMGKA